MLTSIINTNGTSRVLSSVWLPGHAGSKHHTVYSIQPTRNRKQETRNRQPTVLASGNKSVSGYSVHSILNILKIKLKADPGRSAML